MRFNGATASKAMLTGILVFDDKMSVEGLETLRRIERKCGREVLTGGYNKISRVAGLCKNYAEKLKEPPELCVEWFLQSLEWQLKYDLPSSSRAIST